MVKEFKNKFFNYGEVIELIEPIKPIFIEALNKLSKGDKVFFDLRVKEQADNYSWELELIITYIGDCLITAKDYRPIRLNKHRYSDAKCIYKDIPIKYVKSIEFKNPMLSIKYKKHNKIK